MQLSCRITFDLVFKCLKGWASLQLTSVSYKMCPWALPSQKYMCSSTFHRTVSALKANLLSLHQQLLSLPLDIIALKLFVCYALTLYFFCELVMLYFNYIIQRLQSFFFFYSSWQLNCFCWMCRIDTRIWNTYLKQYQENTGLFDINVLRAERAEPGTMFLDIQMESLQTCTLVMSTFYLSSTVLYQNQTKTGML